MIFTHVRKLLFAVLLTLGLSGIPGCVWYDDPPAVWETPDGSVIVEPDVYYRVIVVSGVPHRVYYRWVPRYGWRYSYRVRVR
jgi:hypothetical protein